MSSFYALIFQNLKARPVRTLLTVFGILLGVSVILAISITNESTLATVDAVFNEASGKAHLVVESSSSGGQGLDEGVRRQVQNAGGVLAAAPSVTQRTALARDVDQWRLSIALGGGNEGSELVLYGIDPAVDRDARVYRMAAGSFLPAEGDEYVVVLVDEYARENEITVGQDLEIVTPSGTETLRVSGLMTTEGAGRINGGAFGVIPLPAAQAIFEKGPHLDRIDVVTAPEVSRSSERLEALKERVEERLEPGLQVSFPAQRGQFVSDLLADYQRGLDFFSVVALFVGAFLIYNTFSMTIIERTREIGMLRAVGATRRQILALILLEAGLLGMLGAALGIAGGIGLSRGLIGVMSTVLGHEVSQAPVPLEGLVSSVAVGGSVTLASALWPAVLAGRISPVEALGVRAQTGEGWSTRWGWLPGLGLITVAGLFLLDVVPVRTAVEYQTGTASVFLLLLGATLTVPVTVSALQRAFRPAIMAIYQNEGLLGGSNVERAKGRTALTVGALMVSTAMVIGIRGLTGSFEKDLHVWIDTSIGGDLLVRSPVPMRPEFGRRLAAEDGVEAVTPVHFFEVKRADGAEEADDRLAFTAVDPETYTDVASFLFESGQVETEEMMRQLAEGGAVFISTVVAREWNLGRGDTLWLRTRRGIEGYDVAAVIVDFTGQGRAVTGSWRDMQRDFGLDEVSSFNMKLAPAADLVAVQRRLESRYGERRHIQIESDAEFKQRVRALSQESFALFDVLGLIGMSIAALGVINTLTMNVLERIREIGMLRSVGMTRWQVAKMVLAEAGMMGAMGGLFGLIFGVYLSRVFVTAVNSLSGYTLPYVIPSNGIAAGLVIAFIVTQFAGAYPAYRAASVNIIEAIQHE